MGKGGSGHGGKGGAPAAARGEGGAREGSIPASGAARVWAPDDEAGVLAAGRNLFGKHVSLDNIAAVAGATPGSRVTITSAGPRHLDVQVSDLYHTMHRTIEARPGRSGRSLTIHNEFFGTSGPKGTGLGTKIFANQVKAAAAGGFHELTTYASRQKNMNGYYTWARTGYDARIPSSVKRQLPASLKGARNVSDLMKTQAGRAFWKDKGVSLSMKFNLRSGSRSRKVLDAYVKERGL